MYMYMYVFMYVCVCVCVCVYMFLYIWIKPPSFFLLDEDGDVFLCVRRRHYLETDPDPIAMVIIHPQAQPDKYKLALHGYSCTTMLQEASVYRACGWLARL